MRVSVTNAIARSCAASTGIAWRQILDAPRFALVRPTLGLQLKRLLPARPSGSESAFVSDLGFIDIEEQDDAYVREAELPGVKREDVDIALVGNELAIMGELKEKERTGGVRRRTQRTGRFDYRVTLLDQVDAEQIDASLDNGVLTVRAPKSRSRSKARPTSGPLASGRRVGAEVDRS